MIKQKLHWILPGIFLAWVWISLAILTFAGDLPVMVTNILSLVLIPFFPAMPLLKALGMSSGEYWALPSLEGFALMSALYGILLFGLGKALQAIFKKL